MLAGWLQNADVAVAVMGILFQLIAIAYMLPMSLGSAANTCIANSLGAGDGIIAQRYCCAGFALAVGSQVCSIHFSLCGRGCWPLVCFYLAQTCS